MALQWVLLSVCGPVGEVGMLGPVGPVGRPGGVRQNDTQIRAYFLARNVKHKQPRLRTFEQSHKNKHARKQSYHVRC